MGLKVRETGGGNFTPPPEGTHIGICVQVIDLGTQFSKYYGTSKPKVLIGWELPDELNDEGEPFLIWKRYTASLHENSRLRHDLQAWRGRDFTAEELDGFELKNVLNKPCMVSVAHRVDGNATYADVQAVMKLPKNTTVAERIHDLIVFDLDTPDWNVFETFSENLQKTIKSCEELAKNGKAKLDPSAHDDNGHKPLDDEDIPF